MDSIHSQTFPSHRAIRHCAEELLCHRSRYYRYAEQFLAGLADRPDFSMAAYDAHRLSQQQRRVLSGLLQQSPTAAIAQSIIGIVTDVIQGEFEVDVALLEKYAEASVAVPSSIFNGPLASSDICREETVSPAEPLLNMASRLGIPVVVNGYEVRVPMRIMARHLDSPNPTVRRNLQDCILLLQQGGYRLVNDRQRPRRKVEWDRYQGHLPLPVVVWQHLLRWTHLQKKNSRQPLYLRSA